MPTIGLLGYPISHSFSKPYFHEKFKRLKLYDFEFKLFEFSQIEDFTSQLKKEKSLIGFSVTSPHKINILRLLDKIDSAAEAIGAVNCVKVVRNENNSQLIGYNTDTYGFRQSIKPFLEPHHQPALIIGTGGAARAVEYSLRQIGVDVFFLTRDKTRFTNSNKYFEYNEITPEIINHFKLIINTSPAEMTGNSQNFPLLPFSGISAQHFCYDLIYQPEKTIFLQKCAEQGAMVMNGLDML